MTTRIESAPGLCADVTAEAGAVRIQFHVPVGHSAVARSRLADAVLADPTVRRSHQVRLTLPIGEAEILTHLRTRCPAMRARAAGSTCLVEIDAVDDLAVPGWK